MFQKLVFRADRGFRKVAVGSCRAEPLEPRTLLSAAPPPGEPQWDLGAAGAAGAAALPGQWILGLGDGRGDGGAGGAAHLANVRQLLSTRRDDVRAVDAIDPLGLALVEAPPAVDYAQLLASFRTLPGFRFLQP